MSGEKRSCELKARREEERRCEKRIEDGMGWGIFPYEHDPFYRSFLFFSFLFYLTKYVPCIVYHTVCVYSTEEYD